MVAPNEPSGRTRRPGTVALIVGGSLLFLALMFVLDSLGCPPDEESIYCDPGTVVIIATPIWLPGAVLLWVGLSKRRRG